MQDMIRIRYWRKPHQRHIISPVIFSEFVGTKRYLKSHCRFSCHNNNHQIVLKLHRNIYSCLQIGLTNRNTRGFLPAAELSGLGSFFLSLCPSGVRCPAFRHLWHCFHVRAHDFPGNFLSWESWLPGKFGFPGNLTSRES